MPNVEGLYREPPDEFLAKVYRGVDDYGERKSRVLDHMLAIYGETFDDAAFRKSGVADYHGEPIRVRGRVERYTKGRYSTLQIVVDDPAQVMTPELPNGR